MKKQILSVITALSMVLSMGLPALAEEQAPAEDMPALSETTPTEKTEEAVSGEIPQEEGAAAEDAEEASEEEGEEISPGLMLIDAEVNEVNEEMPKLRGAAKQGEEYISKPVDLSSYYNISKIYADSLPSGGYTNAGAEGSGQSWYCGTEFKNSTTVGWTTPWSEVEGDYNTLENEGVEFKLRVSTNANTPVAVAHLTNEDGWKEIDIDDMQYTSLEFLMTFAMSGNKWRNAEIKLNYDDNSVEYVEILPLKMGEKATDNVNTSGLTSTLTVPEGKITLKGASNKSATPSTYADTYIHHYSINTNPEKVLKSISLLSYNYDYDKDEDGNIKYDEDGKTALTESLNAGSKSVTKDKNIYAITGVTTKTIYLESIVTELETKIAAILVADYDKEKVQALEAEIEKAVENGADTSDISNYDDFLEFIDDNAPAQMIVDLSEYYNVPKIWGVGTETGGYAAPDRGNLTVAGDNGKGIQRYWVKESGANAAAGWKEGTWTEEGMHTLTSQGVDFTLKVVSGDTENTAFFNRDYVSDTKATGEALWSTIDLDDYKYTSIELLQAFALSKTGSYDNQEIRLNYKDGTYQYYQFKGVKKAHETDSNAKANVGLMGNMQKNTVDGVVVPVAKTAYMHHYTIAANPEKDLDSISVLSCNYNFATGFENGQTTEPTYTRLTSTNNADRSVPIFAITGITTAAQYREWANEQAKALDTELLATLTIENGEITAMAEGGKAIYTELGDIIKNGKLTETDYPNYSKVKAAMPKMDKGEYSAKDGVIEAKITFTKNMADLTGKVTVKYDGEAVEEVKMTQEGNTATFTFTDRYNDEKDYEIVIAKDACSELGSAFSLGQDATYKFKTASTMGPVPTPTVSDPQDNVATFTATLKNITGGKKPYYVIICAYNDKGKLVGANFQTGEVEASGTASISKTVKAEGAAKYKAIFIDDITTMKTIFETYVK